MINIYNMIKKAGYDKYLEDIKEFSGDIDPEFMGFTDIYYHLSKIIPKSRIVIDLGCAYAPQAVLFEKHRKYIGVDLGVVPRLNTKNSSYYDMTIKQFIYEVSPDYTQEEVFAICSYVPPWHDDNEKLTRDNFRHCFVYYPTSIDIAKIMWEGK